MKYLASLLLLGAISPASCKQKLQGKCPDNIHLIKSNVAKTLDIKKLEGLWFNVYGDKQKTEQNECESQMLKMAEDEDGVLPSLDIQTAF